MSIFKVLSLILLLSFINILAIDGNELEKCVNGECKPKPSVSSIPFSPPSPSPIPPKTLPPTPTPTSTSTPKKHHHHHKKHHHKHDHNEPIIVPTHESANNQCANIKCNKKVTEKKCNGKDKVFLPADPKNGICCNSCISSGNRKNKTEKTFNCATVKCKSVDKTKCEATHLNVYVPAFPPFKCCPTCEYLFTLGP